MSSEIKRLHSEIVPSSLVNFEEFISVTGNRIELVQEAIDLGWLTPGDTVPAFERAMDALAPNELSEPVKSQFGWHLIEVLERRKSSLNDEQKRKLAYQVIARRKAEEAFNEWLQEARDSAYVDIRIPQIGEAP